MNDKERVVEIILSALPDDAGLDAQTISDLIETPKTSDLGDLAFPCFALAKSLHKAPQAIAAEIAEKIETDRFEKVLATGPYVNFFLDKSKTANAVIADVLSAGTSFGDSADGAGRNVTLDMSSPNIAKPFGIGHLRSTVIADSLAYIYQKMGYNPVRINHLGDWGKQFGLLAVAYEKWGDEAAVKAHPIDELLKLYVRINAEIKGDPKHGIAPNKELDDAGRAQFLKMEQGDPGALAIWKWFRDESLAEFQRIYDKMNVRFDSMNGEAFYNDKMDAVLEELEEKGLLIESQGATIVELGEGKNPALIKKSDGATLYITRDLAAAIYRKTTYDFAKSLYVVGNEQSEHFKQLKEVLKLMGYAWADDMVHVSFGLVTKNGKKLSTRAGNVILLEPTIDEAIERSLAQINAKNPELAAKEQVAQQVGVGAIKFYDLKTDRKNGYDFDLEAMVSFEGETGPYVQYAYARIQSILRKSGKSDFSANFVEVDPEAWELVKLLQSFPEVVARAAREFEPSVVAKFAILLAQTFNKYYAHVRILEENAGLASRLALASAVATILKESLRLLGVESPEEM
ncbi:MAG: arginine--tRNA ligase [Streptococcaceae bacterium]|jgi:arginyl-tRNA synthetase|nr:arginine--tRNA ligase [Streptococcaceae bacterium]